MVRSLNSYTFFFDIVLYTIEGRNHNTYLYIYIYIYIYSHPQTVSFYQNSSVWLDTLDARSRDRNPSITLDYVSDHSANKQTTLAKGIFKVFM